MESQYNNSSDKQEYLKSLLIKCLRQLSIYKHRRTSRRALLKLDDAMLKDIGVTRYEAEQEGKKSFWEGDSLVFDTKDYPRLKNFLLSGKAVSRY